MEQVYLMICHIGPVQEFIASARRSRDLWFGSWLLSELAKAAALEIVEQNGGNVEQSLIFPAPNSVSELRSEMMNVANRIVAQTTRDPSAIGKAVRNRVHDRLRELSHEAFLRLGTHPFDRESAQKQIDDSLELFWVAYPLDGSYAEARKKAEALMAARKVTREFGASTWGAPVDKSSLDGLRESVIPPRVYLTMKDDQLRRVYGIRRGEKLCGIGLMKRLGGGGHEGDFLSTSHIAAQSLLGRLTDKDRPHVEQYKATLRQLGMSEGELNTVSRTHPVFGRTDGHLLYIERLSEFFQGESLAQAQQALARFLENVYDKEQPNPYYALLHADGDHMGRAISAQQTIQQHRALSRSASAFAAEVKPIVDSHKGSLIYAGGDDVLAMLPLHTAIVCAKTLVSAFRDKMSKFRFADERGIQTQPTLSVGMAVIHHLAPLSRALELVREAERAAKRIDGKNALSIILRKRAGAERTAAGTWGTIDERLEWFIKLYREDAIPAELSLDLQAIAVTLQNLEKNAIGQDLLSAEVKRVLGRKTSIFGTQSVKEEIRDRLVALVDKNGLSIGQLVNELIIAREFALVYEMAYGKGIWHHA